MNNRLSIKKIKILLVIVCTFFCSSINLKSIEASSKYDYILIGDSRTVGMYISLTQRNAGRIVKASSKVNNKEVMFFGAGSEGYNYWFENQSNYSDIKNALNNAKKGAKCIIWLGVNDLHNCSKYASAINMLANNYPNVNFYYDSVTAVNKTLYHGPVTNNDINMFNTDLNNQLKNKSRYNKNLFYEDIQNKVITINNVKKTLYKCITDDTKYTFDGLHYTTTLYKEIWNQTMTTTKNSNNTNNSESNASKSILNMTSITEEKRNTVIFNDVLDDTDYYANVGDIDSSSAVKMEEKINTVVTAITNIGIIFSILMLAIIGIKYLLGIVEEKAEYKKDIIPYLIGAALTFGICTVVKILQAIGNSINNI